MSPSLPVSLSLSLSLCISFSISFSLSPSLSLTILAVSLPMAVSLSLAPLARSLPICLSPSSYHRVRRVRVKDSQVAEGQRPGLGEQSLPGIPPSPRQRGIRRAQSWRIRDTHVKSTLDIHIGLKRSPVAARDARSWTIATLSFVRSQATGLAPPPPPTLQRWMPLGHPEPHARCDPQTVKR